MATLAVRRWVAVGLFFLLNACGGAAHQSSGEARAAPPPSPAAPPPPSGAPGYDVPLEAHVAVRTDSAKAMAQEAAPTPASAPESASKAPAPEPGAATRDASQQPSGAGSSAAASAPSEPARRMLDIEARYEIEVEDLKRSIDALWKLAEDSGGHVTQDSVHEDGTRQIGDVTLRVPAARSRSALDALESLGVVLVRNVHVKDISKAYFDAALRLENLEVTLARYLAVLEQATEVEDILRIEAEAARLRGEIEQIKGELRWLENRSALATIHARLYGPTDETPDTLHPKAKLQPGLRLGYLGEFQQNDQQFGHLTAGLSIRGSRHLSVDVDLARRFATEGAELDGILLTLGGEMYSDFLGGGQRRTFNPYLGVRGGYARLGQDDMAVGGITLGLELIKTEAFWLEVDTRILGTAGEGGPRLLLHPSLGANVAF